MKKRTDALWIAAAVLAGLVLAVITTALMPLWLPVLLVKPSVVLGIQQKTVQSMSKRMIKVMMSS